MGAFGGVYESTNDGATWQQLISGKLNLNSVWGSNTSTVYFAGDSGALELYNGKTVASLSSGTTASLHGIWGSSVTDVYAVGDDGTVLHSADQGATWQPQTTPTTQRLESAWGSSAQNVWAVGDSGTILQNAATTLTALTISPTNATVGAGATQSFVVTGTFSDGTTANFTALATWSSSNTAAATISNSAGAHGVATGVAAGSTTVTASYGGLTASANLSVVGLVSIVVTPATPTIHQGQTQQFVATGDYSDGSTQDITAQVSWSTSNPKVASITPQGLASGLATGSVTVSAMLGTVTGSTTLTISAPLTLVSIAVTPANPTIHQGQTQQFVATGTYSDNSTQVITTQVTWSSSNTIAATISNSSGSQGLATGVSPGSPTIVARLGIVNGSTTLTVLAPVTLVSIAVTPASPSLLASQTQQFVATGTYSDNSTQVITAQVTWSSSNTAVATISNAAGSQGLATALAAGTTTIKAVLGAVQGSTSLSVVTAILTSLTVTPANPVIGQYASVQFTATGHFSDGTTKDETSAVTWKSSSNVASIYNGSGRNGLALGNAIGTASITATLGSISGTATIGVLPTTSFTGAAPATANLRGVWGASATDVFAVGDGGTILHYDGASWTSDVSGTAVNLRGVWGTSSSDVFAVGDGGTILHSSNDGATWTAQQSAGADLRSIWGSGSNDVIAVGLSGTVLQSTNDGASWNLVSTNIASTTNLLGVWGSSASDVYVVGSGEAVYHSANGGASWQAVAVPPAPPYLSAPPNLNGVWGSGAGDVYFIGDGGTILRSDGTTVTDASAGPIGDFTSVWGSSATDVYATAATSSSYGIIFHSADRGASWQQEGIFFSPTGGSGALRGIWGSGPHDVWAVQDSGGIYHNTNAQLTSVTITPANPTIGVGQTLQFQVTGTFADGTTANLTFYSSWSSSNTSVATITNVNDKSRGLFAGTATGVSHGTTQITATVVSISSSTTLTTGSVTALASSPDTGTYGGTTTLTATLTSGGQPLANETVTFSLNGTSVGTATTDATGLATLSGVSLAGLNAGAYPSYVTASFAGDTGYAPSTMTTDLTVTPALLTITADNKTSVEGAALPTLTASYSGFVPGDTAASLTTPVTLTTTATTPSDEGSYSITPSAATDPNYTITFVGGTLTISDPAVAATGGFTVTATEGQDPGAQTVATFTDPAGAEALADYSATIAWGDMTTSTGAISYNSGTGVFTVRGGHTYAHDGTADTITATIHHDTATPDASVTSTANVACDTSVHITAPAQMTADINPGTPSSYPGRLLNVNGTLFFTANDGTHGVELWKSDGTAAGTAMVADINPGSGGSNPTDLVNVGGTVFFNATDGSDGAQLWKSDGTAAGTVMVSDVVSSTPVLSPNYLTNVGGTVFFEGGDSVHGRELWKSNGTAGTVLVKDINPGSGSSLLRHLTNVNGTLFFAATDGTHGEELWRSDGTATGTVLVADIQSGSGGSYPYGLTNVNGTLLFSAHPRAGDTALYRSDGTAAGTVQIADLGVLFGAGGAGGAGGFTNQDGTLYLAALSFLSFPGGGGIGLESLWKSDGTAAGTSSFLSENALFDGHVFILSDPKFTNVDGTIFFTANDGTHGFELWKSDGTTSGTHQVADLNPGAAGSYPIFLTNVNGALFFNTNGTGGAQLWASDGTAAGTIMLTNGGPAGQGTFPRYLTNVNGTLFFSANDGTHGAELWDAPVTVSRPLVASAGGPYAIQEGASLTLDASGSVDRDNDPLTYSWAINGVANAATGAKPTLTWAQLQALGVDDGSGAFTIMVTVNDPSCGTTASASATLSVSDPAVMATGGFTVNATIGVDSGSQMVATFTDPGGAEALADYSAAIGWGDGTTSAGTITYNSITGVFTVSGDHTYTAVGSDPITVTIHHDTATDAVASSSAMVVSGATTTTISAPGIVYGANGMVTVTVSSAVTPTGSVSLSVDGAVAVTQALVNGSTTFTVTGLGAGNHSLNANYLPTTGFNASSATGTLMVAPAGLTVTAHDASKTYGAANPAFTVSYVGFVIGDTPASLGGTLTFTTSATAASHVGTYTITPAGLTSNNYTITFVSGMLSVTPAALTITADSKSKLYGAALPTLTASYSGFVNGDSAASLTAQPTLTTNATASSHVSGNPYTITASGAVDSDYTISYVAGTLTITPVGLTITADSKSKAYGAALPTLTASYSGFVNGDNASSLTTAPTLATNATAASHVSGNPYTITASGAVDSDYTISYVAGTLTVTPVGLTITADNQMKAYGAPLPSLTASYSGFVNADNASSLTTQPTLTTNATAASHVSGNPYTITASGAVDSDYTIAYVNGTLTVTPLALTITADNKTKAYGAAVPTLTASYSGFVNGDTTASLAAAPTLTTNATAASHVSGNPYTITASGAVDSDYTISYVAGTLTVTPVGLTITADNQTKAYGAALPTLTASYSGFVNGDTAASLATAPTLTTNATAASHVSGNPYTITASGAADSDYTISYVAGTLTVTPVGLTIAADNKTKAYGAALPTLTASYSGFVNGDNASSLTTAPALTTNATAASHVSGNPYTITASGAVDSDYTISYVAGTVTVTPAGLTITADNQTKAYGTALPTLTASYSGFVNGDTTASLATQPTLTTNATAASHVSGNPYTITASGAVDGDYTISYVSGSLTITPVALSITADSKTKPYGAALPTLTASYSGFVNGDNSSSLTTQPTLTTNATAASHLSGNPYAITASGAADADYTISYVDGTLTVTPMALTITADNKTKAYGAAVPSLMASYSGFVNGDTAASLTTAPTLTTNATAVSHVSGNPYTITASGAVDSDYTISYVAGTLTVTPVGLTITADSKTKAYGAALPTLTASYSGFVNGDSASSLTTQPTLTTNATAASHVSGSPYTIAASGAVDSDYTISYVAGTLTVTPVGLTITADNKTKVYGAVLPALTATYSGFVNGDTAGSLTAAIMLSTSATAASPVGTYAITASGGSDPDYTIAFVAGTLSVTPAALTVAANNVSKVQGSANPTFTATYTGLVNGDTASSLGGTLSFTTTATTSSPVGTYPITPSGVTSTNYTITFVSGVLTIIDNTTTITGTPATSSTSLGQPVTLHAAVTPNSGSGTPTGSVDFFDVTTNTDLGSVTLVGGSASLTTSRFGLGSQTISLAYSGDGTFLASSTTVTVTSTAAPSIPTIYVLDPSTAGALSMSSSSGINVGGNVYVDSSSATAISASGAASITAAAIDVVGGVQKGPNVTFSVTPTTVSSVADPLAAVAAPSTNGLTNYGAVSVSGNNSLTINPGIYTQISVSGSGSLTLNPGIYIIEGGGLAVTGHGNLTGNGVLLFNAGSNYPSSGGNFGGITLSSKGTVNLSAATSGAYTGLLIYQSRDNTRALSLSGATLSGTVYAANALLTMSSSSQLQGTVVVGTLSLSGSVSLTQLAPGSDGAGDSVGIANTLLAGNLQVYINDPGGNFTPDMLARIQDAINGWDTLLAPYSVTITEVSDPTLANLVIDDGTTSASGTAANGVLGCYNPANSEITIILGWNWYAGADPSQISAGRYDFQTTIEHELGHALGLGGSASLTSPMNETLPDGTARRVMTVPDLNIPYPPRGADPLTAAGYGGGEQTSLAATVPSTELSLPLGQAPGTVTVTTQIATTVNPFAFTIGRALGQLPGTSPDLRSALDASWARTIMVGPIGTDGGVLAEGFADPQSWLESPASPADTQPAKPQGDPSDSAKTGAAGKEARVGTAAEQATSEALGSGGTLNADAVDAVFSGWDDDASQHPLAEVAVDSEPVALALLGLYFGVETGEAEKQENGRKFQR